MIYADGKDLRSVDFSDPATPVAGPVTHLGRGTRVFYVDGNRLAIWFRLDRTAEPDLPAGFRLATISENGQIDLASPFIQTTGHGNMVFAGRVLYVDW